MNVHLIRHHCRTLLLAVACVVAPVVAFAQPRQALTEAARAQFNRDDKSTGFKENPRMLAAFHEVVAAPSRTVVRVRCDGKDVARGTDVAGDGLIITKNSEV